MVHPRAAAKYAFLSRRGLTRRSFSYLLYHPIRLDLKVHNTLGFHASIDATFLLLFLQLRQGGQQPANGREHAGHDEEAGRVVQVDQDRAPSAVVNDIFDPAPVRASTFSLLFF